MRRMGWVFVVPLAALGLVGCGRGARGVVAVAARARDSAAWRVREVERWRVDTVYVPLPAARDSVAGVADSVSVLENAVAVSYCAVAPDGRLTHALRVKGGRVAALAPVVAERRRDSVAWRERVERVEVPVAVERRRSGYERLAVGAFPWLVLAVVLGVVGAARRLARRFF